MSRSITIKDVARHAGVTIGTVSAALSGNGQVSQQRREQIRKLAQELGYQPKFAARLMRASRTGRLGLIIPGALSPVHASESGFTGPILASFVSTCERLGVGYHIEFLPYEWKQDIPYPGPEQFSMGMVDGAVVAGRLPDGPIRKWFEEHWEKQPWVALDEPGSLSVMHDTAAGVYRAVEHLAALRHQRIAYVGVNKDFTVFKEGLKGFRRAVETFGLDTCGGQYIQMMEFINDRTRQLQWEIEAADTLLGVANRPTAIFCQRVPSARAVVYAAMRRGLRVPEDLSVITYGTCADAEKGPPPLDCVEPDHSEMLNQAIPMLRAKLRGEDLLESSILVAPNLVQRGSVVPCK